MGQNVVEVGARVSLSWEWRIRVKELVPMHLRRATRAAEATHMSMESHRERARFSAPNRYLVATVAAGLVMVLVMVLSVGWLARYGSASLVASGSSLVQAPSTGSCATDGVATSFGLDFASGIPVVTSVVVRGLERDCVGAALSVSLAGADHQLLTVATENVTAVSPELRVKVDQPVPAAQVEEVNVAVAKGGSAP